MPLPPLTGIETTSPTRSTRTPPPSAPPLAQDGSRYHTEPFSPGFSSTSTADGEASPVLPPLPAPRLPNRVQEFLRTPSPSREERDDSSQYRTASWGSPYPPTDGNLRSPGLSSDQSDGSLIHHLEIATPFLRPAPFSRLEEDLGPTSFISAAVLANRARRPAQGLTEDWIRQHTATDLNTESQAWLSDGSDQDQEPSLLSGSEQDVDIDNWLLQDHDPSTPRANPNRPQRRSIAHQPNETLTQAQLLRATRMSGEDTQHLAAEPQGDPIAETRNTHDLSSAQPSVPNTPDLPEPPRRIGSVDMQNGESGMPSTPVRALRKVDSAVTPRLKKKVPWRGKNIMMLLPRDDERGQPGRAPMPLTPLEVQARIDSFHTEGWNTDPFSLGHYVEDNSQSRDTWPWPEEVVTDRETKQYQVTLPDLNRWKRIESEMREAKLRALGVTFANEEPEESAQPSPAISSASRNTSGQYPALPFSPPLPPGSAQSGHTFNFNSQFGMGSSAGQSPKLPLNSPHSFTGQSLPKHRPGQSIAVPHSDFNPQFQHPSPLGWNSQQMLVQQLSRNASPSLIGLPSPGSPYENGGFPPPPMTAIGHGRTQSLQYPVLPHQNHLQMSSRASPRLQELREDDEDGQPQKGQARNARLESEDGQYHLEQQFEAQLEEEEYSPDRHDKTAADLAHVNSALNSHIRQQSSGQFLEPNLTDDLVIHHPIPHSRGHSVSKNFFAEHDEAGVSTDDGSVHPKPIQTTGLDNLTDNEAYEIETNPSNLGTPVDNFGVGKIGHHHSFSTASNPWQEFGKAFISEGHSRRVSHSSMSSISKLNVEAPEFKFNPSLTATFNPTHPSFMFGGNAPTTVFTAAAAEFTPGTSELVPDVPEFKSTVTELAPNAPEFTPGVPEFSPSAREFTPSIRDFAPSIGSRHVSQASNASSTKINAKAPVFSPQQSDFNFSTFGPKFRPDAPTFTPSLAASMGSPGSDSANSAMPIFSNIDMLDLQAVNPEKKSRAIPIVKPASPPTDGLENEFNSDNPRDRLVNNSCPKRVKAADDGDDSLPRFSNSPEPATVEVEKAMDLASETSDAQNDENLNEKDGDDESGDRSTEEDLAVPADLTTLSSTIMSESTDSKAATSPSATSPEQSSFNWAAFDLKSTAEAQNFNLARPFGEEEPRGDEEHSDEDEEHGSEESAKRHMKRLSAAAKPFTPSGFSWDNLVDAKQQPKSELVTAEPDLEKTPTAPEATNNPDNPEAAPAVETTPTVAVLEAPTPPFVFPGSPTALPDLTRTESPPSAPIPAFDPQSDAATEEAPPSQMEQTDESSKEPSFEEIDSVMRHLGENPDMGVKRNAEPTKWHHPSPKRSIPVAAITDSAPILLQPPSQAARFRSDAPSPSPHRSRGEQPLLSTELDDPFVERPGSAIGSGIHNLNGDASVPASEWDEDFSDGQQELFEERAPYFDRHLVDLVGNVFEHKLDLVQNSIVKSLAPSLRRDRRSASGEPQHSDADDEDDEPVPRRSMSPRRNGRYELTRAAVAEVFNTHAPQPAVVDTSNIMKALEDMNNRLGQHDAAADTKMAQMQRRVEELEDNLHEERAKTEAEVTFRREAQDSAAEARRALEDAKSRLQTDVVHETRVRDLEEQLKKYEQMATDELDNRRATEEKLSEIQRQLRISSEEEYRLRDLVEEKDEKMKVVTAERDQKQKAAEDGRAKSNMRHCLLEGNLKNETKQAKELQARLNTTEATLRSVQQDVHTWRNETEACQEKLARQSDDLTHALHESRTFRTLITSLQAQTSEVERSRDNWSNKCSQIDKELTDTTRKASEEMQRLAKSEQGWLARQEILEARLQAEAKTRERIEEELARLENIEQRGLRAMSDNERLNHQHSELRSENHKLEQTVSRYKREFEEAREAGLREVQLTRISMQNQLDASNHEVNVVREEYEEQNSKLSSHVDQLKLEIDTSSSRADMLVEAAESAKAKELEELVRKHQDAVEDMQTRFERQISTLKEDSQRSEQNYLERLTLSTSKNEHLQERVAHLTERLDITNTAAKAAALAAKHAIVSSPTARQSPLLALTPSHGDTPAGSAESAEKFSAKAFRETIDSLQGQLETSSRKNEELMAQKKRFEKQRSDLELAQKSLANADDEKLWLNEILDIREAEMLDLCRAVKAGDVDVVAARDAAIRLEANIQMHLKGIKKARQARSQPKQGLTIAGLREAAPWTSIRDAAPMAAQALSVLGSWGKAGSQAGSTLGRRSSPAPSQAGLMTPPASTLRRTSPADSSLGLKASSSISARRAEKMPAPLDIAPIAIEGRQPHTPPMMHSSAYDDDAQAEDFDDAGLFGDEE